MEDAISGARGFELRNLAPGGTEWRTFLALAAGHLLFAAALVTVAEPLGDYGLYIITPLYALPLVLAGPKDRILVRILVLLIGFALVHYGASWCAAKSYRHPFTGEGLTDSLLVAGAIGGAVGAAGSLLLCRIGGLMRAGAEIALMAGIVLLATMGGVGLSLALGEESKIGLLALYTPWQLAFAWVLAKTLRP